MEQKNRNRIGSYEITGTNEAYLVSNVMRHIGLLPFAVIEI